MHVFCIMGFLCNIVPEIESIICELNKLCILSYTGKELNIIQLTKGRFYLSYVKLSIGSVLVTYFIR